MGKGLHTPVPSGARCAANDTADTAASSKGSWRQTSSSSQLPTGHFYFALTPPGTKLGVYAAYTLGVR